MQFIKICAGSMLTARACAAAAESGAFNVVAFNVAGLPEILQGNGQDGDKTTNTALIGSKFAALRDDLDIIHVQEDFNYHATLYQYDNHPYRTATSGGVPFGSGLNTLSNYPWIDEDRVKWNKCNGVFDQQNDCLTPKGFTFMRVRLDEGVYVDVYNLHADAGTSDGDQDARRSNIQQVVDYIAANSLGNAVIVAGDTNSRYTRSADNINIFRTSSGPSDPWVDLLQGEVAPLPNAPANACGNPAADNVCETVDKTFYRSSKSLSLTATDYQYISDLFLTPAGSTLSDHNPILANFTYTLSNTYRQSDMWGGPHGTWFNDLANLPSTGGAGLSSITLKGGSRLDSISFLYADGTRYTHGGSGGTAKTLTLNSGESFTTAVMCQGQRSGRTRIFYVKLTTSAGRTLEVGASTSACITVNAPASGWGIVASMGRSGDEVDRLGFVFRKGS